MTTVDVIGAGVVGSAYAAQLARAGHDVHVVARGRRAKEITDGVRLHDTVTGNRSVVPASSSESARPDAEIVLVAVGAHQLTDAVRLVPPNDSPVVFLGNGIRRVTGGLPEARAVIAAAGAGGTMERGEVQLYDTDKGKRFPVTLPTSASDSVRELFTSAGIPVDLESDMVAWRHAHQAVLVAAAGALDLTGGDCWRLVHTPDARRLLGRAVKETFDAIVRLGLPLTPSHLARFRQVPEPLLQLAVRQMFASDFGARRLGEHARYAATEYRTLAAEVESLLDEAGLVAPHARMLCRRLTHPTSTTLIVGSKDLASNNSVPLGIAATLAAGLWWRRRR